MCAISLTSTPVKNRTLRNNLKHPPGNLGGVGRKGRWIASGTADWHLPPRVSRSPFADSGGSFVTRIDFGTLVAVVRVMGRDAHGVIRA